METLTHSTQAILHLASWISNNKELLGVVIGGSGLVSLLLERVKRWLALQSHAVITILHYLFALIAVGVHYVVTSHSSNPTVLFAQALIVLGTNQFVYPLFTKPLTGILVDAKTEAQATHDTTDAVTAVQALSADF